MELRELTPMMRQYFEVKHQYPDHILFYRLGDFYEMFYEDAVTASRELDLVLTGRNAGEGVKAPLCGIPYHSAEGYIGTLVKKGYSVAICEQMEDPKSVKGLVKREVIRVITPGTLTEASQLDATRNNFLLSIYSEEEETALAYIDLSTFEIELLSLERPSARQLESEIRAIAPSEILTRQILALSSDTLQTILKDRYFEKTGAEELIRSVLKKGDYLRYLSAARKGALLGLLRYVLETQHLSSTSFQLTIHNRREYVGLDSVAIANLELFETLRTKDSRGSLYGLLNRTGSAMGARRLREWIRKPLRNPAEIQRRQDHVAELVEKDELRKALSAGLSKVADIERILAKLVFGSISPREIQALLKTLETVSSINISLKGSTFNQLEPFTELQDLIETMFLEDLPVTIKDGGFIRPDYTAKMKEYSEILTHGDEMLLALEAKERSVSGIKNLKIRFNRVFGYFFDVTNSYKDQVPEHFIRKQTLAGSERYFTEELKTLEHRILSASDDKIVHEKELYQEFLSTLKTFHDDLLILARKLSELDVLTAFASVASEFRYTRPLVNAQAELSIIGGRHPVIESLIGRDSFVSNDTFLDHGKHQFAIITGPNMGGKSTYLRQVALISLLAHIGSFVPAEKAVIPVLDQIFTRVGASDDLASGQSTFLVEMSELALILEQATEDSLVILDEIGRGTGTYDGLSIAWASVEYLTKEKRPLTLFATHYHELTEIEQRIEQVSNFRVDVKSLGNDLILLRKIVPGISRKSYGIEAATLAGLPKSLLERAKGILTSLEQNDLVVKVSESKEPKPSLDRELLQIDPDALTPLEALVVLSDLVKKAKHAEN